MLDYFIEGFHLTNSAYKFVLFSLVFYLAMTLALPFTESAWWIFATIIVILSFVLSILVYLISPLILEQQQTDLSLTQIYSIFKSNLHRAWKGSVLFLLLFILIFIISGILFAILLMFIPGLDLEKMFTGPTISTMLFFLILSALCSFTLFVPIFYSLKNQSFISSLISSIKYITQHFQFFVVLCLFYLAYLIPSLILASDALAYQALNTVVTTYLGTVGIASTLIYFQKHS